MNSNIRFYILLLCSFVASTKIALAQKADVRGVIPGMTIEQAEKVLNGQCTEARYDYSCSSPKFDTSERLRLRVTNFLMPPKIYFIQFSSRANDDSQALIQNIASTYNARLRLELCNSKWSMVGAWMAGSADVFIKVLCGAESGAGGTLIYVLELADHSVASADSEARLEYERKLTKR